MNATVLIAMYNEWSVVEANQTLLEKADIKCYVVRTDDNSGRLLDGCIGVLPDLSKTLPVHEVPSYSIARNYSALFSFLYEKESPDIIVGITGDTLLTDAQGLVRVYKAMEKEKKVLACTQAIGQNFHAENADPANGRCGGRLQYIGISDFMPQLFFVNGAFAQTTKVFSNIKVTNPFTSEQCLGDSFMEKAGGAFLDSALVLSQNAYGYTNGVKYHAG